MNVFSAGVVLSIIYTTIFFHPPLPKKLLPTFFILMTPPAIGFVSYIKISGGINILAKILYVTALTISLLLLFQLKRFMEMPFSVSWWAFLFPSAVMTIATVETYLEHGRVLYHRILILQLFGLLFLTILLSWKTIELAIKRKLCVKEK